MKAIDDMGYETPTPIQAQSIPTLLKGLDLLGIAQTGTGKTAAFTLPILHRMASNPIKTKRKHCQVLILTPTRELASQIENNIIAYSKYLNLSTKVIFGGVSINPQLAALRNGIDILIATPGRLLDHMSQGTISYDQLSVFILDEADRMLDMGFLRDIKKIIAKIPKQRQTLLFSATMPKEINDLALSLLKNPKKVEITPESTTVEKIDQTLLTVTKKNKKDLLQNLLADASLKKVLVFSRTKHGADRIVKQLAQAKIESFAIHGNKSQNNRERALDAFTKNKVRVLVATDIAARGIDIKDITHVINYNLPEDAESYVHRIGRTARAGTRGIAISFCDETELKLLRGIEKTIRTVIPHSKDHSLHISLDELKKLSLIPKTDTNQRGARPGKSSQRARSQNENKQKSDKPKKKTRRSFK